MGITDDIKEKSGLQLQKEGEYYSYDSGGVEAEVGEFLYGITKILKPKRVLTTGIYTGISDMYIAQGLKDNESGQITALEIEEQHLNRARVLWGKVQVSDYIRPILMSSLTFEPEGMYQMMFLDTECDIRFKELIKFYPYLEPGGYVFLHDLHRHLGQEKTINPDHPDIPNWPWGTLPYEIKNWINDRELIPFYFPTPRGITGFYKARSDDYHA